MQHQQPPLATCPGGARAIAVAAAVTAGAATGVVVPVVGLQGLAARISGASQRTEAISRAAAATARDTEALTAKYHQMKEAVRRPHLLLLLLLSLLLALLFFLMLLLTFLLHAVCCCVRILCSWGE